MLSRTRVLFAVCVAAIVGGPFGTAPAFAQTPPAQQAATDAASVTGTAVDPVGAPLAGVTVTLRGRTTLVARTGANGAFTFTGVTPGLYALSARKPGYQPAAESDVTITAGTPLSLSVQLQAATLTSLQTIGRTSTNTGRSPFNVSPASVALVSRQTFIDQGQPQVQRILDQTPGVVIDHPGTSATNAAPGAITFPSVRGGLGFETASLIDGHPLAVGNYGDYVTTFLNAYTLGGVEVIKGPGASAPEVNYAIGGTVNFRTLDPAARPSGSTVVGVDSFGGTFSNYLYTGTTTNAKFGWVLDYGVNGTPGPLHNAANNITLGSGAYLNCAVPTGAVTTCGQQTGFTTGPIASPNVQNNPLYARTSLVACCTTVDQTYSNKTELVKARYSFSGVTTATVSYLGSQTWTDQNGNHVYQYAPLFSPGAGYTGTTFAAGSLVPTWQNVFLPKNEWEINNEPIFQAEVRTALRGDNVVARFYGASINRLQYNADNDLATNDVEPFALYGTASVCPNAAPYYNGTAKRCGTNASPSASNAALYTVAPVTAVYNGQTVPVTLASPYFRSAEEDKLRGGSFEYDHFLGRSGNVVSLAIDSTGSNTYAYDYSGSGNAPSVAAGSSQRFTTLLLRGTFNAGPKFQATLSGYLNAYHQHFTPDAGRTFSDFDYTHDDARLGLEYRPTTSVALRASAGSAIAPPYLNLLDRTTTAPTFQTGAVFATQTLNAGNRLRPETSFGYDLGGDLRVSEDGGTVVSFDLYRTNLFNQFLSETFGGAPAPACASGTTLVAGACVNAATRASTAPTVLPVFVSSVVNLGSSRYEGLEASVRRDPTVGFGFTAQGALIRAYPYNVSPCFYGAVNAKTGQIDCSTAVTNLAVVPGANYFNSGTSGSPGGYNAVSNHAEPYAQGYGELRFRTARGGLISYGATYYGNNNSLNVPAFFVTNANLRFPIGDATQSLSINIDNLNNVYGSAYITPFGGVPVPLLNGKLGLTNANVIGPRNVRISFTKRFGR